MKRNLLSILSALVVIYFLAGCASQEWKDIHVARANAWAKAEAAKHRAAQHRKSKIQLKAIDPTRPITITNADLSIEVFHAEGGMQPDMPKVDPSPVEKSFGSLMKGMQVLVWPLALTHVAVEGIKNAGETRNISGSYNTKTTTTTNTVADNGLMGGRDVSQTVKGGDGGSVSGSEDGVGGTGGSP